MTTKQELEFSVANAKAALATAEAALQAFNDAPENGHPETINDAIDLAMKQDDAAMGASA